MSSSKWFAPTPDVLPPDRADIWDEPTPGEYLLKTPRAPDSLSDIDARIIALNETVARLTAAVKGRARAACCPKCGYYFTMEREEGPA